MKRMLASAVVLAVVAAIPLAATAADEVPNHPLLNDRFRVSAGAFYAESTTQARLGTASGGTGIDVDFEDTLGLPARKIIGEFGAYWRISERWRVDLNYFRLTRKGSRTLEADVTWGGNTYSAGTTVNSSFEISDLRAAVGYSFFRTPDKELGVGLGLHSTAFKASLDSTNAGAKSESATAPLPILALYGNFALTDTWALRMSSDWLSLAYDKYSGSIRATTFDVVYQPFRHVAFGVGLHSLNMRVGVDNPHSKFDARVGLQGPAAYMSVSF